MADEAVVTLGQVAEALNLTLRAGEAAPESHVTGGLVGDLLSHIMSRGRRGMVWITIQAHPNIVAVAALGALAAVIIADGFEPDEDTIARADEEAVPLYTSCEPAYALSGKLYELGVR